jgi:hypothetical protein
LVRTHLHHNTYHLGSAAEKGMRLSRTPVRFGLHEQIAGRGLLGG